MTTAHLIRELESRLRDVGDPVRARGAKAYLKSELEFLGVAARPLREVARAFLDVHPELDRDQLVMLVRGLWTTPFFDLRAVAVALLERRVAELPRADLRLVEELVRRSGTWALVDWLATKIAAPVVERDPARTRATLRRWSRDEDFWLRRASILALLPALRSGEGDFELFAELATPLLAEREFFIRKAIGWVLRDVARRRPERTRAFLAEHLADLSGLTLREACRHLPASIREDFLRRHRRRA
ncbi:MAG: DNA alkylation repair protein [Thermoanaerobaculales bacterium]|jgi:3-methyladenine DNA glycosylase AlkD|nr:DNA alkylation repair protein [Thermoanaerobaculales bacterium]